jgi:hypothetical protein
MMTSAFVTVRRRECPVAVAPIKDDIAVNQSQDNGSTVLLQEASNVIDTEPMVDKQVANCQSPFGRWVET